MGPQISQAFSDVSVTQNAITNVLMDSSTKCSSNQENIQKLTISDINAIDCQVDINNISQTQNLNQNFSCSQNITNESNLIAQLKTELDNAAKASTNGIGGVFSQSKVGEISKSETNVINTINMSDIASCVNKSLNSQDLKLKKFDVKCPTSSMAVLLGQNKLTIQNVSQTIVGNQVASCIQNKADLVAAANSFDSAVKASADASVTGITVSGSIACCIVCIIISVILYFVFGSSSGEGSSAPGGEGSSAPAPGGMSPATILESIPPEALLAL